MFPTHHSYPNPNSWKPPASLTTASPQASGRTATPPPATSDMSSLPRRSASADASPPMVEWNEYVTVQSALQSFEDRFEEFMREQSRLLGAAHHQLQHQEKHWQRQQKRILGLEGFAESLDMRLQALTEQMTGMVNIVHWNQNGDTAKERQIGRFKVKENVLKATAENSEQTVLEPSSSKEGAITAVVQVADNGPQSIVTRNSRKRANSGHEPAPQVHPPLLQADSFPRFKSKSNEQVAEKKVLDARAGNVFQDSRPQHGYRQSEDHYGLGKHPPVINDDDGDDHDDETHDNDLLPDGHAKGPQHIGRKRAHSGHEPAPQVMPTTVGAGSLSMLEMLDRLGEEVMGFGREEGKEMGERERVGHE